VKIGIVGGGAIGLLVAAYLGKEHEVTVYTRRSLQAKRLKNEGLRLKKNGETMCVSVQAAPLAEAVIDDDIVFITVKQYDLEAVLDRKERFRCVQAVVFLQNGMGHVEKLAAFTEKNVIVGVVEHGAIKRDDRTVEHTGIGKIVLASFYGTLQDVLPLAARRIPDFPFEITGDWEQMLIKKLIVNAVINPLTALLRVPNGKLLQVAPYYEMMKLLFSELQQVLPLKDGEAAWKHIVSICQKTAENYSSMYMDVAQQRKTEVDAILGYVLKKGAKLGLSLPLVQFLFYAIKGMEEGGETYG
jgi:2-dehydropantoate 2-reductase